MAGAAAGRSPARPILPLAVSNKALGFVVPPERERMIGYGRLDLVLDALEAAVSRGEYLLGNRFSAADVYVGSQLGFGMMFGTIEKRSAFAQYWQRISTRPASVRAKELDDALMPPQSAKR